MRPTGRSAARSVTGSTSSAPASARASRGAALVPVLGAALGGILSLAFLRGKARLTAIAGVVAVKDLRRGQQFEVADADLADVLLQARDLCEGLLA